MSAECSIIVPVFNDGASLPTLHLRLTAMLRRLAIPYEILYVDNGSTDQTPEIISSLHREDSAVKGIILSRRFGRQAALCAGLEAATGRSVITIDGNLTDPPEVIPRLIEAWHEGYEVIFARRRRNKSLLHRAASRVCRRILRQVSEVPIPTDTGELTLMDRRAVEELNSLPERTRFITGLRSWVGFRQAVLEYTPESPRSGAGSVYSLSRQLHTVVEGVLAFSSAPLRLITTLGCAVSLVSIGGLLIGGFRFGIIDAQGAGSVLIGSGLGLLGGVQLVCLGIVGEYMARVYQEVRNRPLYVTRERVGFLPHPRAVRNILEFLPTESTALQETATDVLVRETRLAQRLEPLRAETA